MYFIYTYHQYMKVMQVSNNIYFKKEIPNKQKFKYQVS